MKDQDQKVVVIGGGGHAKVVVSTLQAAGRQVVAILDDDSALWGGAVLGVRVTGPIASVQDAGRGCGVMAIGHNRTREKVALTLNLKWLSVIHPRAFVHHSVKLGAGTVVFAGAVIQPEAVIGQHVIVNTGATIDHDCQIDDFVHIAPGCHLAGGVRVEEGVFLGINSSVLPYRRIGAWTTVGAGATVIGDLPDRVVAVGVPAKIKNA